MKMHVRTRKSAIPRACDFCHAICARLQLAERLSSDPRTSSIELELETSGLSLIWINICSIRAIDGSNTHTEQF